MPTILLIILFAPLAVLFVSGLIPNRIFRTTNARIRLTEWLINLNLISAIVALIGVQVAGAAEWSAGVFSESSPFRFTLMYDGLSTTVLALVGMITWVICRYSVRYLDGEAGQGRFFQWLGFTVASVSLFILSGNLFLTLFAFLMVSIGLHPLLVHYEDRKAGANAAWLKFGLSRVGDVCLMIAAVALFREYGTANLGPLFTAVSDNPETWACQLSGWMLMLCGLTKSAQFPFHTWLPDTMEAPTPVSALMHAGIVNGGGYLLIRLSPIVALAPQAMMTLAVVGGLTACVASLCMLTQTSVKKTLAWSTIAQMGFMMLQCGLMAWTAALLHIVAHSFYKAHAFLSSGSVLNDAASMSTARHTPQPIRWIPFAAAIAIVGSVFYLQSQVTGLSFHSKPGGWLLGLILCAGISRWVSGMLQQGVRMAAIGIFGSAVLLGTYQLSFLGTSALVSNVLLPSNTSGTTVLLTAGLFFVALLLTEILVSGPQTGKARFQALRVHALNGFYFDAYLKRSWTSLFAKA